jgi:hypothetical protein
MSPITPCSAMGRKSASDTAGNETGIYERSVKISAANDKEETSTKGMAAPTRALAID